MVPEKVREVSIRSFRSCPFSWTNPTHRRIFIAVFQDILDIFEDILTKEANYLRPFAEPSSTAVVCECLHCTKPRCGQCVVCRGEASLFPSFLPDGTSCLQKVLLTTDPRFYLPSEYCSCSDLTRNRFLPLTFADVSEKSSTTKRTRASRWLGVWLCTASGLPSIRQRGQILSWSLVARTGLWSKNIVS